MNEQLGLMLFFARFLYNSSISSSEQYFMDLTQVQRTAVYTPIMKEYKMSKLVHTPETVFQGKLQYLCVRYLTVLSQ